MFCRKCGKEIPNDSVFCLKCGTKVIKIENGVQTDEDKNNESINMKYENNSFSSCNVEYNNERITAESDKYSNNKPVYAILGLFAIVIFIIIVVATASENAKKCSLSSCDNLKVDGSEYCMDHTCQAEGCMFSKSKFDKYCYTHQDELCCEVDDCDLDKTDGGDYCFLHTCDKDGCLNKKFSDTDYCIDHQVDMRKKLRANNVSFGLNSAGGVCLTFVATNISGKEIKYVRFKAELKNAVGDLVQDEIKDTSYVDVEIVGPVKPSKDVVLRNEIIAYCDTCARVTINDVTLVYTDGTSETGHFGYYYER